MKSELVTPTHLARRAIVYIRQSTPAQVVSNVESLRLQYALGQRARELGWHASDIDVIDADLGLSGASTIRREGFKELAARVGLSEVGLVLSIDVTRLARNCSDWYPLLDICGLRGCLIADRDGVYDPGTPNGRLLLGLKGTISELELHTIRSRLTAGLLAKASRGDLALTLPVGLVRMPGEVVVKDPDLEVQARLGLVFSSFVRLKSAASVMRHLNAEHLDLPRRDRHGDLRWTRATVSAVTRVLKNPAYAGAFVYGRKRMKEQLSAGGGRQKVPRKMEDWRIVVKNRYPAYVDWRSFEAIQSMLADNRAEYMRQKTRGAPREGDLLLQGIAWCARCGHKMYVRYKGGGEYVCNHLRSQQGLPACQSLRAAPIDTAVAQAFLTALAPAELDAVSRANRTRRQADGAVRAAAEQQLERKRYQAALAERQYNKVDPDNRLVASELERRWEEALIDLRAAEDALTRRSAINDSPTPLDRELRDNVIALAGRLPALWDDPITDSARRKALLRCLVEKVILERGPRDVATVRIVWRGGATSELAVARPVNGIAALTRGAQMQVRILELAHAGLHDEEIAVLLTQEGHRSPTCPDRVHPTTVQRIRLAAGVKTATQRTRWRHGPGQLGVTAMAARMGIPAKWLYVQIRSGRILIDRQPSGAYLFDDTPETVDILLGLRNRAVTRVDLRTRQLAQEGQCHE
jgi:DNA invertase Pin-like site-specific DNA recombinase